jgi:hypothetical protein
MIAVKAQKVDSMFVNLYTDSLKKGTYNYINVDGLMSNGSYLPLDSNYVTFNSDHGKFFGNSLWLDRDFKDEKVHIRIALKSNSKNFKEFDLYIKKKLDDENLKTSEQIIDEMRNSAGKKKKS